MSATRLASVAALLLGAAGCVDLDPEDGLLTCNPTGKPCPTDYFCDANNRCVRNGHPGGGGGGGGGGDGGSPGKPNGQTCSGDNECNSGVCADHVCCDRACDGQCEACDVSGSEGTCSLVTGTPHAPRANCNGSGACAGSCDGSSKNCAYPSTQTVCGAACDGKCDGAGNCSSSGGTCPNGFACGASGCLTACTQQTDCQPFFMCNAPKCERIPESNCLDGVDNNGDGLADCADPTCTDMVQCVPVAPTGGELGVHITSGSCPANYATPELFHTGLQPKACTGCTCTTQCKATTNVYTGNSCNTSPVSTTFTGPPDGVVQCRNINATTYTSGTLNGPSLNGCVGSGTATQADPTWTTDDTFCAAKTSATCSDTAHVCVAKPPSTPVCARVDQAASCPAGYTGTNGVYYSDFMRGTCGSCASCNQATTLTCKAGAFTPQALTGANCTGGGTFIDNTCGVLNRGVYASVEIALASSGPDNCTSNVSSTPPTAIGATRICCQ